MKGKKQIKLRPLPKNIYVDFQSGWSINFRFFTKYTVHTKVAKLSNLEFATFLIHHNRVFLENLLIKL